MSAVPLEAATNVVIRRGNYSHRVTCRLSVGEQVRALRTAAGLTQHELAARISSTQPAVAHLEAGHRTPTLATLTRIAQALGHDLEVVLPCGSRASEDAAQ